MSEVILYKPVRTLKFSYQVKKHQVDIFTMKNPLDNFKATFSFMHKFRKLLHDRNKMFQLLMSWTVKQPAEYR